MKLWIVTIGSSDVQLDSDKTNQEKGRNEEQHSDKVWRNWYNDEIQADCYDIPFEPQPAFKDKEENYRIPPRILGIVYNSSKDKQEIQSYLTFPLLNNFVEKLSNLGVPDAIAILLTDQSNFFQRHEKREKIKSPYWQDTCELQPILENYLRDNFPNSELIPLQLSPQGKDGLDDWDSVLDLVRNELDKIKLKPDTVYVSHQAGTPAISSAVQFMSLARFRTNVQFLVSNEYSLATKTIYQSTYLGAIQRQEAKALLDNYDYAGIRDILGLRTVDSSNPQAKRIKYLLDAAEQWNRAEFQKFKKIINNHKLLDIKKFPWYQSGYESAYLAWVRFKQGSIIDALFHSFRAAEGSISKWIEKRYNAHVVDDPKYGPQVKISILNNLPGYSNELSKTNQEKLQKYSQIGLYGDPIYDLLKSAKPQCKNNPDVRVVWEGAKTKRNKLFYRLEGLQESELFDAWNTNNEGDWKRRLLGCLNFIAQDDLPEGKPFSSLEEASVMARLHGELEKAIAQY